MLPTICNALNAALTEDFEAAKALLLKRLGQITRVQLMADFEARYLRA
ncbi:hypothetical protein ACFQDN_22960 [Pseudomonas asuensis]|uniref:Uncharacterized protein n=1 Tax=Pseudomonas asuensis TaxID=1825787 RepID=A0ABQ2H5A0_9PSED|nr:hypothetical protein [Pseudomonas asuensis]GGM32591.1 hypothetical protein GCM10009425_48860 [Pseudomonas asuensis]